MGIPAIRESIVLHRQGLATLKEPNCLCLSLILAVVCSGLRWLACFPLFSLTIIPNSGGDLWWFAVICGSLRWFVVVCLIVIPSVANEGTGVSQLCDGSTRMPSVGCNQSVGTTYDPRNTSQPLVDRDRSPSLLELRGSCQRHPR